MRWWRVRLLRQCVLFLIEIQFNEVDGKYALDEIQKRLDRIEAALKETRGSASSKSAGD